jgi:tetratricopeptide (TPR) repeat protein
MNTITKREKKSKRRGLMSKVFLVLALLTGFCPAGNAAENIAEEILNQDKETRTVTPQMVSLLREVIEDASKKIEQLQRPPKNTLDIHYVTNVFKCIDDTLIAHGFVYPDDGLVSLLADGLTPFQMATNRLRSFEASAHNHRRRDMIAARFPGPFYAVDCDTASFIYLGVGEQLKLPIHLIEIPGRLGYPGHNFVRWRAGTNYVNWETMDGKVESDKAYRAEFDIPAAEIEAGSAMTDMTREQVLGYEQVLLAIEYEARGQFETALKKLDQALALYPANLLARNNFAWDTAVGQGVTVRDYSKAIMHADFVLNVVDDPDVRDTLAAAYASAGFFNLAVAEEQRAIKGHSSKEYQKRLALYKKGQVYRQNKASDGPVGEFKP